MLEDVPSVVVIGSINMDLVARAVRLPAPGETLVAHGALLIASGGKGANQAVAAARLGARTSLIARVGDDEFGRALRRNLEHEGVDCRGVGATANCSSGVAMIVVDDAARNTIVVVPGANGLVTRSDIDAQLRMLSSASVVVLQMEIPFDTIGYAMAKAHSMGTKVLLNPAPAQPLPDDLMAYVDFLVPNETEASILTGMVVDSVESAKRAAEVLCARGAACVIITLGAQGVVAATNGAIQHYKSRDVRAVDTTGAGDTFIGGLCAGLVEGQDLAHAIALGQAAAAIKVTRMGAQASTPYREELDVWGAAAPDLPPPAEN
jgi:ribokinase